MAKALLASLALIAQAAFAQSATDAGTPATGTRDEDEIRREIDQKVEAAKKEMREEARAQLATQSVAQGWQEEWVEEKRKLELFTLDGYLRVRPELFNKLDLNRGPDPGGFYLYPHSPISTAERTQSGANMRLRLEPTLNVSEEVRVRMQLDVLDNVVFGSNDYVTNQQFNVFSETQAPSLTQSTVVAKRVYGEVTTPVGILRFGRMGSHWGLGVLHNDGNCLECDHGDTVDRIQFVTNPLPGWYIAPMMDFNLTQLIATPGAQGEPFPLSDSTTAHSYVLVIARRDTDQEAKAKLDAGQAVFNFGLHLTYRSQKNDLFGSFTSDPYLQSSRLDETAFAQRGATLWMPDVWAKYERKLFRIEAEVAGVIGVLNDSALDPATEAGNGASPQSLNVLQFGGAVQSELRLLEGKLRLGLGLGFASGDSAPGFGLQPNRTYTTAAHSPGNFDGAQYSCTSSTVCPDNTISNFTFNRDYRVDEILFRTILGGITDAAYVKPTLSYELAEGLKLFGAVIYSRAIFSESTPSAGTDSGGGVLHGDANLGLELNVGARYETEDGFVAGLTWAVLFPLQGLGYPSSVSAAQLDTAQALRGFIGIKF